VVEKEGFTEGAVYVLSLEGVHDWTHAITQPRIATQGQGSGQADPFANTRLKVQFKGYGRWKVRHYHHGHSHS
jgi:hypothetical protein